MWIYAALAAVAGLALYTWRRTVTLQESLTSATAFLTEQRQALQTAGAAIPDQVRAAAADAIQKAMDKAVADYIATHPTVEQLDGVTRESLIAALQSVTDDARSILNNVEVIPVQISDALTPQLPLLTPPD